MRHFWLLGFLFSTQLWLCSQLWAAPSGGNATTSIPELTWQADDWQEAGEAKQIGKQLALLHKSEQGYRLGLALLLPEWQLVADLLPLSHHLNQLGFDTLIMLPHPKQQELDPNAEHTPEKEAVKAFRDEWQKQLIDLQSNSGDPTGYQLMVASGSSAVWLSNLLVTEAVTPPDALILVDAFYPAPDANEITASELAMTSMPLLDLYQPGRVTWLDRAAKLRRQASKQNNKLNWRQVPLQNREERLSQVAGWLNALGWK